ncbi:hypothetical protein Axy13_020 [Achromobacter phage vB_AxyP_19-32_Axy13]|uniref:Uncharacterized protein n=1 Tax=Achromobacter phage vB_AxyP_19-32_Axy13 TaxID=2591044 RepID=A0A514CUR1_9CAUD|nr:hypothetical protein Axy13_020 [Achromobacter phage vB_AxyP_19-32_Axy13]
MKVYAPEQRMTASNAWGHDHRVTHQVLIVEESDVGTARPHYLGYNHKTHVFTKTDVGCAIVVYRDGTGWTNWVFALNWESKDADRENPDRPNQRADRTGEPHQAE